MSTPVKSRESVTQPPCHSRPRDEWCDKDGPGGFMGHTCQCKSAPHKQTKVQGMRLIPELTEPTVEAVLEALLKNYTCGALLTILASIHEKHGVAGQRTCAPVLLSILELRQGVAYVKDERTRTWSMLSTVQVPVRKSGATTGRATPDVPTLEVTEEDA